jgi:RNA recognition motif-containing protein
MNILIKNLNQMTTASHLFNLFIKYGLISSVKVFRENVNGHSSGVAYLKMDNESGAAAVFELDNLKFMNYYLEVSEVQM